MIELTKASQLTMGKLRTDRSFPIFWAFIMKSHKTILMWMSNLCAVRLNE